MTPTPVSPYAAPQSSDHAHPVPPVSMGEWIWTMLVMVIPIVNLVMMFVWAFSSATNPSKANFFKAILLLYAILFGLGILAVMMLPMSVR